VAATLGLETKTPLSQTSFFPFLTQVYFLPAEVEIAPSFVQLAPDLIAAYAVEVEASNTIATIKEMG
jgi:hypothetical protein